MGPVAPAVQIMARNPAAAVPDAPSAARGVGLVDAGASVSAAPLWAAQELGIEAGGGGKQTSHGAGGGFGSHHVMADISAEIGGRWIDVGVVVGALSPDTESSRRQDARPLFLLARDGFLDKFNVCFDEPDRAMWIRNAGGGAEARRRRRGQWRRLTSSSGSAWPGGFRKGAQDPLGDRQVAGAGVGCRAVGNGAQGRRRIAKKPWERPGDFVDDCARSRRGWNARICGMAKKSPQWRMARAWALEKL